MMFLIRAKIHPENIWRDWLLPTSKVVHPDIECDSQIKACYKDIVLTEPARSVYDEQGFFTIYVHAKPGAPAFKEGSIFYQREVRDPIEVRHSIDASVTASLYDTLRHAWLHSDRAQTSWRSFTCCLPSPYWLCVPSVCPSKGGWHPEKAAYRLPEASIACTCYPESPEYTSYAEGFRRGETSKVLVQATLATPLGAIRTVTP